MQWTMNLAEGNAALAAASGLIGGTLHRILIVDFAEILTARVGITLFRRGLRPVNELQHAFRGHFCGPALIPSLFPSDRDPVAIRGDRTYTGFGIEMPEKTEN